jgi:hypothetical protein
LVEEGVKHAQAGNRAAARLALETAARACPRESAPFRELAGLDALDGNWTAAADHASEAVERDADDDHAWRILGTASYLRDRPADALHAWNHLDEPTVDLVDVTGLKRTRYAIIATAIDAPPGTLVTHERLTVAERRTREIPAIGTARVIFQPLENGRAQVDVNLTERSLAPATPAAWAGLALHALTDREVAPAFASVTGGGELMTVSWRWWKHRPRAAFSLAAPAPRLLGGGVWRVDAFRETETFGRVRFEEVRTSMGVTVSNWLTASTRLEAGASLDRWRGRDPMAALSGAIEFWPIHDRLALDGRASGWMGAGRFGFAAVQTQWRSTSAPVGSVWLVTSGVQAASGTAPASLWPGADTGHVRDVLLRAHPLLDDGIITGGVFGRRLVFGSAEWRRWLRPTRWPVRLAPALFVDTARATRGLESTDSRTHLDAGVGVRLALPGGSSVLRVDLAKGLRDGHTALTVGWTR